MAFGAGHAKIPAFAARPEYPAGLLESNNWYACRTRARSEKRVDELMALSGIETYLPLILRERQWADRKKCVAFPLLPGYVFARFPLKEITKVLNTSGVVDVARPNGYPTPIREEELDSVRQLVEGVNETGVVPSTEDFLEEGQEVWVVDGPFKGMRGRLQDLRGHSRVCLRLSAIRQAMGVEIDRTLVRPVRPGEGANLAFRRRLQAG